jgi:hypothetical protein
VIKWNICERLYHIITFKKLHKDYTAGLPLCISFKVYATPDACYVIVVLKCGFITVFKRSIEEDSTLFAVYAGDKILQFNIVNMPEVLASEAKHANP